VTHEVTHEFIFSESRCKKTLINQGFNYKNWWSWGAPTLLVISPHILY